MHITDPVRVEQRPDVGDGCAVEILVAGHEAQVEPLGELLEFSRLAVGGGNRLVDEHMFAGRKTRHCDPVVGRRRRRNHDRLNGGVLEDCREVAHQRHPRKVWRRPRQCRHRAITQRGELGPHAARHRLGQSCAAGTDADDRDPYRGAPHKAGCETNDVG